MDATAPAETEATEMSDLEKIRNEVLALESKGDLVEAFSKRFAQFTLEMTNDSPEALQERKRELLLTGNSYVVRLTETGLPRDLTGALKLVMRIENLLMASASTFPKAVFYELESIVCANFSCVYRLQSQLRCALSFAERGLAAETKLGRRPIGTHLNICAIFSEMHQHNRAAHHAHKALQNCRAISQGQSGPDNAVTSLRETAPAEETSRRASLVRDIDDEYRLVALQIAAHYSFAAQMEHSRSLQKALQHYEDARALLRMLPEETAARVSPDAQELERAIADIVIKTRAQPRPPTKPVPTKIFGATSTALVPSTSSGRGARPGRRLTEKSADKKVARFKRVYHSKPAKIK